jgi:hypothetical protein
VSACRRLLKLVPAAAALALAALAVGPAQAEQSGRGGVVVAFNARLLPKALPRQRLAPVAISLSGGVRAAADKAPPRLSRIELAFAAGGSLDVTGLQTCPRLRLRNATRSQALARCGAALVGRGSILAEVPLAPERPLLARAGVLAFNGRQGGHPAVWVHAYSASPPVSFVLPFTLRPRREGAYGLSLEAPVARALGRWPRLRSFRIELGRRYLSQGRPHSYLRARCALPPRFHSLSVPIARATYQFAPAPTIATTILRACRVRD